MSVYKVGGAICHYKFQNTLLIRLKEFDQPWEFKETMTMASDHKLFQSRCHTFCVFGQHLN